nr:hypothetical protein [Tanacetum cinerariifolium]
KEEPPRESDICQLIREECCVEASKEQKQSMEDTMLELVKICHEKEFLCIHDDIDDLIESALNSKLLLINSNSQHLDKKEQEVKNVVEHPVERGNHSIQSLQNFKVVHKSSISFDTSQISSIHTIAPILSTKEPEHSLSMGVEEENFVHQVENDVYQEEEIDLEDISQIQDVVLREKLLSITRLISNIDVDASVPDPAIVSVEEKNVVHREEEEERLINLMKNDVPDNLSNDPLLEEANLFLSDDSIPPGIENVA